MGRSPAAEKSKITFQEETYEQVTAGPDLANLARQNWEELERYKEARPWSIDLPRYKALMAAKKVFVFTARCDGRLVGYSVYMLVQTMRYGADVKIAISDLWYLLPEHRKAATAVQMLQTCERGLKAYGASHILHADPLHRSIAPLFQWLGYRPIETTFEKVL